MKNLTQKAFAILILLNLCFGFQKLKAQTNAKDTYSQEIKNLSAFAKSYGYIRFFYPNTQTEDFNWDAFLVYGTQQVRNLKTDSGLKSVLSDLFSPIAPYAIFSNDKNEALKVKPITQGDSITFWQHSSFSIGETMGAKSSGSFIKLLVTTAFDSTRVIQPDNHLLRDEVQFEHINYGNDARFHYPDNFRNYYNQEAGVKYILGKQPNPNSPLSSKLITDLWITMPIALSAQESKHLPQKAEIEAFSKVLEEFYTDEKTIYQEDDIWYSDFISAWNGIHHFFPYRKSSEINFDFRSSEQLALGLKKISIAKNKKSTSLSVVKDYVSLFQDGHANVFRYQTPDVKTQNSDAPKTVRSWLPFYRVYSQGKIYVMRSFDPKIKNGDEIMEINNKDVINLIDLAAKRRVSSPQKNLLDAVSSIGYFVNTKSAVIKLKRDDKILTLDVNTIPAPAKEYFEHTNNPFEHKPFEYPSPKTIYINPNLASAEDMRAKLDEMLEAEHLIVDLRNYPNQMRAIFEHLPIGGGFGKGLVLNTPLIMHPNQEYNYGIWTSSLTIPKAPFITADISVLIGSSIPDGTQSRGETFASYLKSAGATLIGDSNSMGAAGGVDWFTTPGKIRVVLTTSYTVRENGEEMQTIGITPDILVKQTVEGLKEGKDQVYEAALKRIQQE